MVAASKRRRADETNPYNAKVVNISTSIGTLRHKGRCKKAEIRATILENYKEGNFRRIQHDGSQHIMLKGFDEGAIGYIVPAECIEGGKELGRRLSESIEKLPKKRTSYNRNGTGTDRGLKHSRMYTVWATYANEPRESGNFKDDGEVAEWFVEEMEPLWIKASDILGNILPRVRKDYSITQLPEDLRRKAGVWMGMAVNIGSSDYPVATKPHRDVNSATYGMSCLYPLGNFKGGEVILWDLQVTVVLQPGDLLFFPDHLIIHSNMEVTDGVRHSVVASTRKDICDWQNKARKRSFEDYREERMKKRKGKGKQGKVGQQVKGLKRMKTE
jgi:hypothetical protein